MSFKVIISDGLVLNKCIESVVCRVDTPNDSNARFDDVGNLMEIVGRVGMGEPTVELYLWSLLPTSDSKAYRNVQLQILGVNAQVLREVTFPNAFVVDYYESFSTDSGAGVFNIYLKQKKDKNDVVKVVGDLPALGLGLK